MINTNLPNYIDYVLNSPVLDHYSVTINESVKTLQQMILKYEMGMAFPKDMNWVICAKEWASILPIRYIACQDCIDILESRHKNYGAKPILKTGFIGIIIRSLDKMYRIEHMIEEKKLRDKPDNYNGLIEESIKDNYIDLFNYSILACLLTDGHLVE